MSNKLFFVSIITASAVALAGVQPPPHPGYANCPIVYVGASEDGTVKGTPQPEPSCKSSVDRTYMVQVDAARRANQIGVGANLTNTAPVPPPAPNCGAADTSDAGAWSSYQSCMGTYNAQMREYNLQKDAYDRVTAYEAQAQSNIANATSNAGSATNLLSEMKNQNLQAQSSQQNKAQMFSMLSQVNAMAFAASCSGGATCQYAFMAASIAFALLSSKSSQQAGIHGATALEACESYNKLSSTGSQCGSINPEPAPITDKFPIGQIDPTTGQCKAGAPATCETNRRNFENAGIDVRKLVKDAPSNFAGADTLYKTNKDGTITTKDGKTYKASDFADRASMIAAGMAPGVADQLMNDLYGDKSAAAKLGLAGKGKSLADDLKAMNKIGSDFGGGGGDGKDTTTVVKGKDGGMGVGGPKDMDGTLGERKPASTEGLTRNFNGDAIGIASDNIFKMMNRRYIQKKPTLIGVSK